MRLILAFSILWGMLYEGDALICNQCIPVTYPWQCTNTESECGTGSCGSMTVTTYRYRIQTLSMNFKTCLPLEQCITGRMNFGWGNAATVSTECCKTDLCNSQDTPELNTNTTLNGKKCFSCHLGDDCKQSISCEGNEDRCMKTTIELYGEMITAKGCASSSICGAVLSAQLGSMSENLNCCEGNLCNGAKHVGGSVLLLLGSAVSVLLFY